MESPRPVGQAEDLSCILSRTFSRNHPGRHVFTVVLQTRRYQSTQYGVIYSGTPSVSCLTYRKACRRAGVPSLWVRSTAALAPLAPWFC